MVCLNKKGSPYFAQASQRGKDMTIISQIRKSGNLSLELEDLSYQLTKFENIPWNRPGVGDWDIRCPNCGGRLPEPKEGVQKCQLCGMLYRK